MQTNVFIALLNPSIALVLAAAFLGFWHYQRRRPYLLVLSVGYVASATGFLLQYFTLPIGQEPSKFISAASFAAAVVCIGGAMVARFGGRSLYRPLAALGAAGLAAFSWFLFVEPDITWRACAMNAACGFISLVVANRLRTVPEQSAAVRFLQAISCLAAANFLARAVFLVWTYGAFETLGAFQSSNFWTTTLLCNALISLLLALGLIAATAREMFKVLEVDSRTDQLSGLLNRRGFEERAAAALQQLNARKLPAGLVLADLDHFKSVNDRFGHAVGDVVIAAFAKHLRATVGEGGIVARLGGEEFAVLLPATDLSAARLFAEAVRASFGQSPEQGIPADARVTASFGVASDTGVALADLLSGADEALYRAKTNGRDRVRIFSGKTPAREADAA